MVVDSRKILIVRLSSIGDIIQCMPVASAIKSDYPDHEIHWITRSDFFEFTSLQKSVSKVWSFDRKLGLKGWLRLCLELRKENYWLVYDAHNNLRSFLLRLLFLDKMIFGQTQFYKKSKNRLKRFFLFKLSKNFFSKPYIAQKEFLKPVSHLLNKQPQAPKTSLKVKTHLDFPTELIEGVRSQIPDSLFITLVPSASKPLKIWPVTHWKNLIRRLENFHFVILGGPQDNFCEDIKSAAPERVINLAGSCSLKESFAIVSLSKFVISGDTGFLHAADVLHIPCIALLGPSAFGHPASRSSQVLETELSCRPCTKDGGGRCRQKVYQKCMFDITPEMVASNVRSRFKGDNTFNSTTLKNKTRDLR